jgi:uncharacterized protein (TIGR03086 family)
MQGVAMKNIAQFHREALDSTRATVAGVRADQLTASTPNDGWDVRTLLNHIVVGNLWAVELVSGRTIEDVGNRLDGDVLGADPLSAYDASATAAAAAFEAPGALDAACAVSYGPVPGSVYAGHRFIDVLIHGWDLAVATDQDTTLDTGLVQACLAVLEPQLEQLKASGAFGEHVDVPPEADVQTRLLGMLGRRAVVAGGQRG